MHKYGIYNETKNQWEYVIADTEPTTLPDNPGDTPRVGSVFISEMDVKMWDGVTVRDVSLDSYKVLAKTAIDYQSRVLLAPGITHLGQVYPADEKTQGRAMGLSILLDKGGASFPVKFTRLDGVRTSFANQAAWDAFLADYARVHDVLSAGGDLKDSIDAATDEAGVDAVNDTRT